jgi:hypothetical protein
MRELPPAAVDVIQYKMPRPMHNAQGASPKRKRGKIEDDKP